uniref:Uncharacterized protein n=2 Tax=Fagus sylvatica TaxID=28930 RepID=A0A2N9G3R5_FAGSY
MQRRFEVHFAAGRDLRPGQLANMIQTLENWLVNSDNVLHTIEEKIEWAEKKCVADKKHQEEVKDRVEEVKKSLSLKENNGRQELRKVFCSESEEEMEFYEENRTQPKSTSSPTPRLLLHSISSVPPPAPTAQLLVSSSNLHFLGSASSLSLRDTRRAKDQPRPLKSQPLSLPCRVAVLSASLTLRRQIFSLLNSQLLSLGQSVTPSPVSLSPLHAATHITIACSSAESTNMMENEEVMGGTSDPVDKLVDVEIDLAESQLDDLTEDIMKMDINKENNDEPPSMGSNADMV